MQEADRASGALANIARLTGQRSVRAPLQSVVSFLRYWIGPTPAAGVCVHVGNWRCSAGRCSRATRSGFSGCCSPEEREKAWDCPPN